MMRSMFAGVSGLRAHQTMMDVVSDNISNINTTGYKASRVVFQDTLSQVLRAGSGGDGDARADVNAVQVGLGTRVAATDAVLTQGAIQNTGRPTDVAIQGEGYFMVENGDEMLYTRAGSFGFDSRGYLADPTGYVVQGWAADGDGAVATTGPASDIRLPLGVTVKPESTTKVSLGGNLSSDAAVGAKVSTAIQVFDSLGQARRVTFEYEKKDAETWELTAYGPELDADGKPIALGPAVDVKFSPGGVFAPADPDDPDEGLEFTLPPLAGTGAGPTTFTADFGFVKGTATLPATSRLTQYGGAASAAATGQDGSAAGYLRSFSIGGDGTVVGVFSNGESQVLARLAMASFTNPAGLIRTGESHLRASTSSGDAAVGEPGAGGRGALASGSLEMSNVELAQEFTNLIIAQRGFQANSRVISSSDELLQDLVNLKR